MNKERIQIVYNALRKIQGIKQLDRKQQQLPENIRRYNQSTRDLETTQLTPGEFIGLYEIIDRDYEAEIRKLEMERDNRQKENKNLISRLDNLIRALKPISMLAEAIEEARKP